MRDPVSKLRRISALRIGRLESVLQVEGRDLTLVVASQAEVEQGLDLVRPHVVVSMLDPESTGLTLGEDPQRIGMLHFRFHDTKQRFDAADLPEHLQPLTIKQARAVCDFVRKHVSQVEVIVVHCHHGMSRSPAVAAALAKSLGGDDRIWFEKKFPNRTVYELMLEAWGTEEQAAP